MKEDLDAFAVVRDWFLDEDIDTGGHGLLSKLKVESRRTADEGATGSAFESLFKARYLFHAWTGSQRKTGRVDVPCKDLVTKRDEVAAVTLTDRASSYHEEAHQRRLSLSRVTTPSLLSTSENLAFPKADREATLSSFTDAKRRRSLSSRDAITTSFRNAADPTP